MLTAFLEGVGHWSGIDPAFLDVSGCDQADQDRCKLPLKDIFSPCFVFWEFKWKFPKPSFRNGPSLFVSRFQKNLTLHCFLLVVSRDMRYRPFKMWDVDVDVANILVWNKYGWFFQMRNEQITVPGCLVYSWGWNIIQLCGYYFINHEN